MLFQLQLFSVNIFFIHLLKLQQAVFLYMSVGVYLWVQACQKNLFNISEFCKPFIVVRQIFLGVMMGVLIDLIPFFRLHETLCSVDQACSVHK